MSLDQLQFETIIAAARYFPINVIAFAADSQSAVLRYGADEQYVLWDVAAQMRRSRLPWTGSNSYCGQMDDQIGYIMARYESTATPLYRWLPDGTLNRLSLRLPAAQRVTLAPGGERLILWQADMSGALYTLHGKRLLTWQAGYYNPQFTPGGKLVVASQQQQLELWDATTGAPLAAWRPAAAATHQDWFFSCSFITATHLCCIW